MTTTHPRYYESLGRAITMIRTEQGLDRKELADRAGISYSYLAEIENGNKPASSRVLLEIARALGLGMTQLMASAESLLTRQQGETVVAPMATPMPGSRWFHGTGAFIATEPTKPSSDRAAALAELQSLIGELSEEDLLRILDIARRLRK